MGRKRYPVCLTFLSVCERERDSTELSLHFREDVVQLWSGADAAEERLVHLWSKVLLGEGVVLENTHTQATYTSAENTVNTRAGSLWRPYWVRLPVLP